MPMRCSGCLSTSTTSTRRSDVLCTEPAAASQRRRIAAGSFFLRRTDYGAKRWDMSSSKQTTDHTKIRKWAEARNGKPARVQGTGEPDDVGLLRIDFPEDHEEEEDLEEITWDEFFEKFDEKRLAFVYQEQTAGGEPSRFNKFVSR